jgi:hypothetical protein
VLRGTSIHGPLELEIPIQVLENPNETIHQLAAKKAISELEQGRGWLFQAKDESGALLKTKCEGRFDDMIEREAVRLGVQFQVGGKWCSFVAVESNKLPEMEKRSETEDWEWLDDGNIDMTSTQAHSKSNKVSWIPSIASLAKPTMSRRIDKGGFRLAAMEMSAGSDDSDGEDDISLGDHSYSRKVSSDSDDDANDKTGIKYLNVDAMRELKVSRKKSSSRVPMQSASSSLFGSLVDRSKALTNTLGLTRKTDKDDPDSSARLRQSEGMDRLSRPRAQMLGMSRPSIQQQQQQQQQQQFMASSQMNAAFGQAPNPPPPPPGQFAQSLQDYQMGLMLLEQQNKKRLLMARQEQDNMYSNADPEMFSAPAPSQPPPATHPMSSAGATVQMSHYNAPAPQAPLAQPGGQSFGGRAADPPFTMWYSAAPVPMPAAETAPSVTQVIPKTPEELTQHLISLQTFEGFWEVSPSLLETLKIKDQEFQSVCSDSGLSPTVLMTTIAVLFFERKLKAFEGSWELVVDKAKGWLGEQGVHNVEESVEKIKMLVDLSP